MCDLKFRTVRQRKVHLLSHIIEPIVPDTVESTNLKNVQKTSIVIKSSNINDEIVHSKIMQTEEMESLKDKPELESLQNETKLQSITTNESSYKTIK